MILYFVFSGMSHMDCRYMFGVIHDFNVNKRLDGYYNKYMSFLAFLIK